ncbi:hypothetical protein FNH22_11685 [Fulvivirga sp. M361]|uniref:hypothetical protein n=1 Tax=Fulvivirga sp. M361 TaxID=2594266 RepID=UPI00117B81F0|nr:hypothetical protein [Fulvivirga sp. M361]TRX59178.1 hypothetical protein FNH22_11685 [Fulvivirga sp. M361]
MKYVIHIGARLLMVYFVALPILFGLHTVQHQHQCGEDHKEVLEYAQFTPDCTLCDLYHSQVAVVEDPFFYDVDFFATTFQLRFFGNFANVSKHFNLLRGPPMV